MSKRYFKTKFGFTIIETMIAISLFLVVVMIGINSLLNASVIHQKSQDLRSIVDNLNFIMEDMSKNIRTGYNYHCFVSGDTIPSTTSPIMSTPKSCASGWAISFESSTGLTGNDDDQWVYYISGGKIFKSTQGPYVASAFVQLTPDEVVLESSPTIAGFSVLGAEPPPANSQQPFVIIRLVGKITYKNIVSPFSIQTSASQRLVDI